MRSAPRIVFPVLAGILLIFSSACSNTVSGTRVDSPKSKSRWSLTQDRLEAVPGSPDWAKKTWILKVSRALRAGAGLRPDEKLDDLVKLEDSQIVDHFLNDPQFLESVLDFNLHWLGFKSNIYRRPDGMLNMDLVTFANAVQSVKEVAKQGDYLKILDLRPPVFMEPLSEPRREDADKEVPAEPLRARYFQKILDTGDELIAMAEANPSESVPDFCKRIANKLGEQQYAFLAAGVSGNFVFSNLFHPEWYGPVSSRCIFSDDLSPIDWAATFRNIKKKNAAFIQQMPAFVPDNYQIKGLADFRALDLRAMGISKPSPYFAPFAISLKLTNSSTNRNRKRAAYILSRFFCDDLTPIDVEDSGHGGGGEVHASDHTCQACHYKLDPMAGFFKDYGRQFTEYSAASSIVFDDQARADLASYQKPWLNPEGSERKWNIGYVRSITKPKLNSYGESLDDLFKVLHEAPEVKRCMMTRMFEYYVDEGQVLDPNYRDWLAQSFTETAETNSTRAFKESVARLVQSKTFREEDPSPDQCYDFAPGSGPAVDGFPPCLPAAIIQRNCVSCHFDTDQEVKGLDLSSTTLLNGERTFVHVDEHGVQRTRKDTLQRILERLSSSDPEKRMPQNKYMDAVEREKLYLWVNEGLNP